MTLWTAALCGALGGSVRGVLAFYRGIVTWVQHRREVHQAGPGGPRSQFADAADWNAELIAMSAQILIGCLVSAFLTNAGTVTGVSGAILAGISAPAILSQLGQVRLTYRLATEESGKPIVLTSGARDDTEPEGAAHGG